MEFAITGNLVAYFQSLSNELKTPKILFCPVDNEHKAATSFTHLTNTNISYFIAPDASDAYPQAVLAGDDNLLANGVPVKSGVINLWTNRSVTWSTKRHHFSGNVLLADGSVEQISNAGLTNLLSGAGNETNLIVIP